MTTTQRPAPLWSDHARDNWHNPRRNDCPDRDIGRAFRESEHVDYPSAKGDYYGRYHPDGDVVLICKSDRIDGQLYEVVVTAIRLRDRPLWEQEYVRYQFHYGGSE